MAELALGALGVVPLIGFTIKSYQALFSKVKTFRHCSSNVLRLHKNLRVQRRIFENECQLLLRECLEGGEDVEAMMANPSHEDWLDHKVRDDNVRQSLKDNYDECIGLVRDIGEALQRIDEALACFEAVKSSQQAGECLKKTFKRVGDGLRITFNKDSYEASLDELKDGNHSLKTVREQVNKIRKPLKNTLKRRQVAGALDWLHIRRASKTLHEALLEAWTCTQAGHSRHSVKLFVEAEMDNDDIRMDIAILCHGIEDRAGKVDVIHLRVRSALMAVTPSPQLLLPLPVSNDEQRPRKRLKSVRFNDDGGVSAQSPSNQMASCDLTQNTNHSLDLRCAGDICYTFATYCDQKSTASCLGHIDVASEDGYRHQFFAASQPLGYLMDPSVIEPNNLIPMDAVLAEPTRDSFSTIDKLRMAKALVLAVLKFHATPWLGEAWRLQDLAFFRYCQDLARSLRTLHLGVDFNHGSSGQLDSKCSLQEKTSLMASRSPLSQVSEDERLLCGINNLTLHCLGVALLQIDRLQSIEPDEVLTVRKMAKSSSSLGPKYRQLTEQCLRCDFAYGTDLSKPQLQKAVHEGVVDVLDSMIAVLDINDDDE